MKIKKTEFIGSYVDINKTPKDLPEFAFIGRSNVGKSSLINMISNTKIAKISSKPGKTQTINFFKINYQWYLVDLPGYGYAKTSKKQRELFEKVINKYIIQSPNLISLFVLVDANIPPQEKDITFINNLGYNGIPFVIIFTKIDKSSKNKINANIEAMKKKLSETWEELPQFFMTSAKTGAGKAEILNYLDTELKRLNSLK